MDISEYHVIAGQGAMIGNVAWDAPWYFQMALRVAHVSSRCVALWAVGVSRGAQGTGSCPGRARNQIVSNWVHLGTNMIQHDPTIPTIKLSKR